MKVQRRIRRGSNQTKLKGRGAQSADTHQGDPPLCVDLDGTLIRTDLLVESFFGALRHNALILFLAPFWLLRGKAHLKHRLAQVAVIDCLSLPYHGDFVDYLRTQRTRGRSLILTTASHEKYAHQVAEHLGFFDEVIASNERRNLSGTEKRKVLSERFGAGGFDYAGNSSADLNVFRDARRGILVSPERHVEHRAKELVQVDHVFPGTGDAIRTLVRAMRIHQWLKNLLVFVPLLAAHRYMDLKLLAVGIGAFIAFGLCASATYLLNDFLDLSADRAHARKRLRPLASGQLSSKAGALLIPILLAVSFGLGIALSHDFALILLAYLIVTVSYSLWLKTKVLVDVLVLAGLYTMRILAGSAVTGISPSFWLLAFSMFLFLSLAMVKRYTELLSLRDTKRMAVAGRGYQVADIAIIQSLGAAGGYLSVLVLALYINSENVLMQYHHPEVLWLLCPLLLYWISRIWQRAGRGEMHDDPLVYAIKDSISRWVIAMGGVVVVVGALV